MVSFSRLAFLSTCRPAVTSTSSPALSRRLLSSGLAIPLVGLTHATMTSCDARGPQQPTTARAMSSPASPASIAASASEPTGYLNAADAAALDVDLMSTPGFSLEQLMELAGLSVAEAVYASVPPPDDGRRRKVLLVCGPGNNGGDGLVAARHLVMFGYDCAVVYPKRSKKEHFINLVQQCEDVGIDILDEMPAEAAKGEYDAIVDAIFGFSFKGEPREPFATALKEMTAAQGKGGNESDEKGTQVMSVDVPSGWNVDEGDVAGAGFMPDVLISLTTPKLSAREFTGRHFVGGRFLPDKLAQKYGVKMPPYPGVSQVMEV